MCIWSVTTWRNMSNVFWQKNVQLMLYDGDSVSIEVLSVVTVDSFDQNTLSKHIRIISNWSCCKFFLFILCINMKLRRLYIWIILWNWDEVFLFHRICFSAQSKKHSHFYWRTIHNPIWKIEQPTQISRQQNSINHLARSQVFIFFLLSTTFEEKTC